MFFHVVRESLSLILLVCFVCFFECLLVKKEGRKMCKERDPSPCALVAVLSQVKILRVGWDYVLVSAMIYWGFVTNGTWRLISGM